MASFFTLGKEFLPIDSLKLGSLVADKANPLDFYEPPPPDSHPEAADVVEDVNSWERDSSERGRGLYAKLQNYVSLSYSKRHARTSVVSSPCVRTYMLKNYVKYFDEIIELEGTKKFLERALKSGGEPCLVVGFKTLQDAVIKEFATEFQEADLQKGTRSTGVGAHVRKDAPILQTINAKGEQVCALLYRKVRITTRKEKVVDAKLLKKGKKEWYTLTTFRQAKIPDSYEILEAQVGGAAERDSFEFDEDEEDDKWTKCGDEDADYYL